MNAKPEERARGIERGTILVPVDGSAPAELVSETAAHLARARKRRTPQGRVTVETQVWYGPTTHAIVEAARIRKVDQIVMPRPERLGGLLLGSEAESVLHGRITPMLLLRAEGAAVQTPRGDAKPREA